MAAAPAGGGHLKTYRSAQALLLREPPYLGGQPIRMSSELPVPRVGGSQGNFIVRQ